MHLNVLPVGPRSSQIYSLRNMNETTADLWSQKSVDPLYSCLIKQSLSFWLFPFLEVSVKSLFVDQISFAVYRIADASMRFSLSVTVGGDGCSRKCERCQILLCQHVLQHKGESENFGQGEVQIPVVERQHEAAEASQTTNPPRTAGDRLRTKTNQSSGKLKRHVHTLLSVLSIKPRTSGYFSLTHLESVHCCLVKC